jgi:methyl-accepting chemotaxis protein
MSFRSYAVGALSLLAIASVAASTAVTNRLFADLTGSVEEGQFELMQSTVESKLRGAEAVAHSRAAMVASSPATQRLFAARDRAGLHAEHLAMWEIQHEQFGVLNMQFHIAPAISFLRMHNPDHFDDDLSGYRQQVVDVNADHAPRLGAYIGRSGPSLTAVVPVRGADGDWIGSFEVGFDFGPLLDDLKESFDLDATFLVLEEPMREIGTSLPPARLDDELRIGRYLQWYSTDWALAQELVTGADLARAREPITFTRTAGEVPYGVLVFPVRAGTGEPLGVIVVSRDFSDTRAAADRTFVWQLLLALVVSVLLVGGIILVLRSFLLRPLRAVSARFAELSRGEPGEPIVTKGLPSELAELARHHERLRSRGDGS